MAGSDLEDGGKAAEKVAPRGKMALWKRIAVAAAAAIVIIGLAVGLGVGLTRHKDSDGGSDDNSDSDSSNTKPGNGTGLSNKASLWQPAAGTAWQIILKNPLDTSSGITPDVPVFDIDMWENDVSVVDTLHKKGSKVICYFSAGSYEDWRADKDKFHDADLGNPLHGWKGERWVNVSSSNVRSIMATRIADAASRGCDAVDPDNIDGYQGNDDGLGLTKQDSIDYVRWLAEEAGRHNMSTGLKNAADIIPDVLDVVAFSVNEQCVENSECETFKPFVDAGKPVFNIEYPKDGTDVSDAKVSEICGTTGAAEGSENFSKVVKKMELDGWVKYCDGKAYTTKIKASGN